MRQRDESVGMRRGDDALSAGGAEAGSDGGKSGQSSGDRLWALYVQSEVEWRLSKAERESRYRQCGHDMKDLLEWIDNNHSKLGERETVKLLRRVLAEQFEIDRRKV